MFKLKLQDIKIERIRHITNVASATLEIKLAAVHIFDCQWSDLDE